MSTIDTHCHFGPWKPPPDLRGFLPLRWRLRTPADVRRFLATHRLSAVILVPHYGFNMTEAEFWNANELLIDVIRQVRHAYGAVLVSPEADWSSTYPAVEHLLAHPKVVAIKVAPNTWLDTSLDPATWDAQHNRRMERILGLTHDMRLPIQTHTGGGNAHARHLAGFIQQFGGAVDLHCVHMGDRTSGHFEFVPAFCQWLQEGQRVYCDFSWARPFASRWLLAEFAERGLPVDNLLFASDEPWGHCTWN